MIKENKSVRVWEQEIEIPTYLVGKPNKNPMFLEKRVYQGSSGRVYPHSVIDKIYDEKVNKTYKALYIENEYLKIMVLPELGGRIQRAVDKTNNYDFIYYNRVIKPALVGLAGPWVSGGIEFNWPQHHRPSTFDPVDYRMTENEDGSCTIWLSEIENMFRTKGMIGVTLYPGKAYMEISAKIYNRTDSFQTFLWWANPAVAVNDFTQSIFPPDVYAVMDHGKRDTSNFPIATGTYYKMDYSEGVDISRYKNIPVPTSYMVYHSDYDFLGGYDHQKKAGLLHVADHHVSPGKKQWTWGCGEFGKAWDKSLTDEDGPYIELMTGCFTDNQPDFSWLSPYEEKEFKQYFMPYKGVGSIKNATINAAVNLEYKMGTVLIKVYVTSIYTQAKIILCDKGNCIFETEIELSPQECFEAEILYKDLGQLCDLRVMVCNREGNVLVEYQPEKQEIHKMPEPAKEMPLPEDVQTNEELYLCGLHLEQYRHATFRPEDYYLEGLKRDQSDYRINNAYGKLLFGRGRIEESEKYFRKAIERCTIFNPNPYDGEAYYNLGLSLKYQFKDKEAYDAFYKATWNAAWRASAYYELACLASKIGDMQLALEHTEKSLVYQAHHMKARNLKTALLRHLGKTEEAKKLGQETQKLDALDFNSLNELILLQLDNEIQEELKKQFKKLFHGNFNTIIELSIDYMEAGMYDEADRLLRDAASQHKSKGEVYPLIYYYLGFISTVKGNKTEAIQWLQLGERANSNYCFPHRLQDLLVLQVANEMNPSGAMAYYYLGNLWYDKKQYDKAIEAFECSIKFNADFATPHRNLALAYYNKRKDYNRARQELEVAFNLDQTDARVFMELDQLYKKLGVNHELRLTNMQNYAELVEERDDLYLEYVTVLNTLGYYDKAAQLVLSRRFHPWEGGEGKVARQYLLSYIEVAKQLLEVKEAEKAIEILMNLAGPYPESIGEGKLLGVQENHIYYFLGEAFEAIGKIEKAAACYEKAAVGISEPTSMMYYNDQPPEMIFYQGAALMKLGREKEARSRFNKLIDYGKKHLFDDVKIDYFAVSLPDLQIFEEDLNQKNKAHCYFMMGLGSLGLGEKTKADECLDKVLILDPNHIEARLFKQWR